MAEDGVVDVNDPDTMFNEAMRLGNLSAAQANRYMTVCRELVVSIDDALQHLESGLHSTARDILRDAQRSAAVKVCDDRDLFNNVSRIVRDYCNGEEKDVQLFTQAVMLALGEKR